MLITLTTDFGRDDAFVGTLKGVIAAIDPQARVIDLTHGVPAHDVLTGALTLRHAVAYFPPGTVHVAVADPGVGGARRPVLIEAESNFFIGPDNGVLSLAVGSSTPAQIVHLANPAFRLQPVSKTFHGRDIFAPAAAHLSRGVAPAEFGEKLESFVKLALPKSVRTENLLTGEVIYIDKFGNLFTNIEEHDLTGLARDRLYISFGGLRIHGIAGSYSDTDSGAAVALLNSWGVLELAVNKGSAAESTAAKVGDKVEVVLKTRRGGGIDERTS